MIQFLPLFKKIKLERRKNTICKKMLQVKKILFDFNVIQINVKSVTEESGYWFNMLIKDKLCSYLFAYFIHDLQNKICVEF